ncbi:MAG: substrate-binding domain-containing protein, partial [Alphaproteobacteria bacterium]
LAGVRDAITQAGLPIDKAWFVQRPYAVGEGASGLRAIMLASGDPTTSDRPTAILGGNDLLAMGALLEAPDLGLQVPRDLSIIGFDDLELAAQLRPSLTTIRVPTAEMSTIAADYLLGTLEGQVMARNTEVSVDLIARESTAKPPSN